MGLFNQISARNSCKVCKWIVFFCKTQFAIQFIGFYRFVNRIKKNEHPKIDHSESRLKTNLNFSSQF